IDAGFLLFDEDDRLLLANARIRDMFATIAGILEPGARFETIAAALVEKGVVALDGATADDWLRDCLARHNSLRSASEVKLADGRWLRARECDSGDGGTVAIYTDITVGKARERHMSEGERRYQKLVEIGVALSAEKNLDRLLEIILIEAKNIANADGGTIYLRETESDKGSPSSGARIDPRTGGDRRVGFSRRKDSDRRWFERIDLDSRRIPDERRDGGDRRARKDRLRFAVLRNDSLGIAMGGTTGEPIPFPSLPLYDPETGKANVTNIATLVALGGVAVNVPDAYADDRFDFSSTMAMDARTGYRSTSFLTLPMKNNAGEVIGVLQLINARDAMTGAIVPFDTEDQQAVEALASQAAVALDNQQLLEGQRTLLGAFIQLVAGAIDEKSPYTGGHCERVPALTEMLAEAACAASEGPFRDFALSDEERYELCIAAWLHDCGKVTTPEYVVDKATKLETISDRIEQVKVRFEVLKRDAEIARLKQLAESARPREAVEAGFHARITQLETDLAFLEEINLGRESMSDDQKARVRRIAKQRWRGPDGAERALLSEDEVRNLCVTRGTLTPEERKVIDDHIVVTIEMLEKLPFPKGLTRVPEYAGGHHEKMDGSGYPRGLRREQMSLPARMMAVADIFEALTAADRPYKKAMPLSEAMAMMAKMRDNDHIDADLFALFVESGVYRKYAERFLDPELIDDVDHERILVRRAMEPERRTAAERLGR
ncbi:MAG: HD domain-containing phosphohydrolase, partial [Alphaproteobacteria bacterium]